MPTDDDLRRQEHDDELLQRLAKRQREVEFENQRVVEGWSKRGELIRQLLSAICAAIVTLVGGTAYVLHMQTQIDANTREITVIHGQIDQHSGYFREQETAIQNLRLEMKDKVSRRDQ